MRSTAFLTLILLGTISIRAQTGSPPAVSRPDDSTVHLAAEGMTFRLISPRRHETNGADFFLLESEVTNGMYHRYLQATGRKKGDQELAEMLRERSKPKKRVWGKRVEAISTSPAYDVSNSTLLWTNNFPPPTLTNYPVALITIHEAKEFCEWLCKCYPEAGVFRLPTAEEWLIAAYGKNRNFPWGDEWSFDIPCVSKSRETQRLAPQPVKEHGKDKSTEGIFDLWGNVGEYVAESKTFQNATRWMGPSFKTFPLEPEKGLFPLTPRNHWWGYVHSPESRTEYMGFRVLLEPK